jgi:hypothetical protein
MRYHFVAIGEEERHKDDYCQSPAYPQRSIGVQKPNRRTYCGGNETDHSKAEGTSML